jgi:uncharacterized protein (TIGR02246 family)
MSENPSNLFAPSAFTGAAWDHVRDHAASARGEATLEGIREELAVRDAIARYFYAFDGGDLDATMAMFIDDCELINARGTVQGRGAVREAYEAMVQSTPHRLHYNSNQVVRLSADRREAVVTSYHHAIVESADGPPKALGGTIADRLVKTDDGWKFAARFTSADFTVELRATV